MQFPDIFVIFQHELLLVILDRLDFLFVACEKLRSFEKKWERNIYIYTVTTYEEDNEFAKMTLYVYDICPQLSIFSSFNKFIGHIFS